MVSDKLEIIENVENELNIIFNKEPVEVKHNISAQDLYKIIGSGRFRKKHPEDGGKEIIERISEKINEQKPLEIVVGWGPGKNYFFKDHAYYPEEIDWNTPDSAEVMTLAVLKQMQTELPYPSNLTFYTSGGRYNRVNKTELGLKPDIEWAENYHNGFKKLVENIPEAKVFKLEELYPSGFNIDERIKDEEVRQYVERLKKESPEHYQKILENAANHSQQPEKSADRFLAEFHAEKKAGVWGNFDMKIIYGGHHRDDIQYYSTPWGDTVQPWQGYGGIGGNYKKPAIISPERFRDLGNNGNDVSQEFLKINDTNIPIGIIYKSSPCE